MTRSLGAFRHVVVAAPNPTREAPKVRAFVDSIAMELRRVSETAQETLDVGVH